MQDYRNIKVWQKAYPLVLDIYRMTAGFPQHELYGLMSQMRRAAVSIVSNIAEGSAKESDTDFARFLEVSLGSAFELECQAFLARDLGYIKECDVLFDKIDEIKKMIAAFIKVLRKKKL